MVNLYWLIYILVNIWKSNYGAEGIAIARSSPCPAGHELVNWTPAGASAPASVVDSNAWEPPRIRCPLPSRSWPSFRQRRVTKYHGWITLWLCQNSYWSHGPSRNSGFTVLPILSMVDLSIVFGTVKSSELLGMTWPIGSPIVTKHYGQGVLNTAHLRLKQHPLWKERCRFIMFHKNHRSTHTSIKPMSCAAKIDYLPSMLVFGIHVMNHQNH